MKKIGIIDYFIDEWHSNYYLDLFRKGAEELGIEYEIVYGWAELPVYEGRLTTDEWCNKNNIVKCQTIEELCEKSDNILILSPANPEKHLKYAEIALRYGKNTYIDKTFAENVSVAKKIYEIADKYGTKIFSTSALRFSEELNTLKNVESLTITGSGRSLEEYVIHQIEMAVKIMGTNVKDVRVFNRKHQATVIIDFDGKLCTLNFSFSAIPFAVDATAFNAEQSVYAAIQSDYFYNLVKEILIFFDTDKYPFDREETITIIAIRDAIIEGMKATAGEKVLINNN